jgi:hypothetical protein
VIEKFRERLAVSKQAAQNFEGERMNLRKLNELEVRKQYQKKVSDRFATLENSTDSEDVNWLGKMLKKITKPQLKRVLGLCELKQHKLWFDKEC